MPTAPTGHAHMLVYMRWPFCWFCSLVLARSMGNTQVTPISPAMPPLMSLAGRLWEQRECQEWPPGPQVRTTHGVGWGQVQRQGCILT